MIGPFEFRLKHFTQTLMEVQHLIIPQLNNVLHPYLIAAPAQCMPACYNGIITDKMLEGHKSCMNSNTTFQATYQITHVLDLGPHMKEDRIGYKNVKFIVILSP